MTESTRIQELRERMTDMMVFLDCQVEAVTEYSEALVRRLIEIKSGISVEVEV